MAANQKRGGITIGFAPGSPANSLNARTLNASGTALAVGWAPDTGKTLNKVRYFQYGALSGTLGSSDLTCTIYGDNGSGTGPNTGSNLGSSSTLAAPIAGGSWFEFTGLSVALTAGAQYWAAVTNTNGTPAANFPSPSYLLANVAPSTANGGGGAGSGFYGWMASANSGSGYGTNVVASGGWRVGYSDSTYDGLPVQDFANSPSGYRCFGTQEMGVVLTLPANATFNIRRASIYLAKIGSFTSNYVYKIYVGSSTTPMATSNTIPGANISTGSSQYVPAYFASDQAVAGGSVVRLTVALASNTGDSSDCLISPACYKIDTDANSLPLYPFGAHLTALISGAWDDSQTNQLIPFDIGLDTAGEFASSGGGVVTPRGMLGGFGS